MQVSKEEAAAPQLQAQKPQPAAKWPATARVEGSVRVLGGPRGFGFDAKAALSACDETEPPLP